MTTRRNSSEIYRRLLTQVMPYWRTFAAGILAMVILGLTEAGIPAVLKPVLDGTFVEQDPIYLTWAPLGIIVLFLVRGIASVASTAAFATIATRLVYDLRMQMFNRLLNLPSAFYDRHASGTLISKLVYDVTQVTQAGTEVLTTLVKDTVTVVALTAYLLWLDWKLSLLLFFLGPAVALVALVMGRRIRRISFTLQQTFGEMMRVLEESTRGQKVVKIFGGQSYEASRFSTVAKKVRHMQFKHKVTASVGVPVVEVIGAVVIAVVIYIGTGRAAEDQLSVGGFVAFFTALGLLFSPIKRLTKMNDPLQRGLAAAESVFQLIDEEPERDNGTYTCGRCHGEIRLEHVEVRYPGSERNALGPVDVMIPPLKTTALVGASGSGKTTLVNLVPRLIHPNAGRLLLDGVDLEEWSLTALRRQIAMVSQDVLLFNDTIANNIAYGATSDVTAVRAAAEAAGALEFIEAMPDGFDTNVGENGVRLSGGQRQRLAIARALFADAPILIFDEATSALDSKSEQSVQDGLDRLRHGRTTLVIAHRLSTIESADNILVFDQGQIVEQGTHAGLLARSGVYADLYRAQYKTENAGQDPDD